MNTNDNKSDKNAKFQEELRRKRALREADAREKKAKARKKALVFSALAVIAVLALGLCASALFGFWPLGSSAGTNEDSAPSEPGEAGGSPDISFEPGVHRHVEIHVQDYGVIPLALDPTYAPITVANFINLAESGYYDGVTFHRIMEGFMVQGGNNTARTANTIKGEFSNNDVENPLKHKRGVISMARIGESPTVSKQQAYGSATGQFFIVHEDSYFLDGDYASFGWVTTDEGLAVVDEIARKAHPTDKNGTIPLAEQPVITKVTVLD